MSNITVQYIYVLYLCSFGIPHLNAENKCNKKTEIYIEKKGGRKREVEKGREMEGGGGEGGEIDSLNGPY
jgi:hypothetical protein